MIKVKHIFMGIAAGIMLAVVISLIGINNNGWRTVIQYPNGTTSVKFDAGWYPKWFGSTEVYPDVITYDYNPNDSSESSTLSTAGVPVRYQDGGTGTIYGIDRFMLPDDEMTMLKLHKDFRSPNGVANKLLAVNVQEVHQMTAGLMTSEGAYAEQRGTYIKWSEEQLKKGKYVTKLEEQTTTDATGKETKKNVPVIVYEEDEITPKQSVSDLAQYGVTVSGHNITEWDFEKKTLDQISKKREATMGVITAIANAELAKQNAITAEQAGLEKVMIAKYQKEEEKIKAVVLAQQVAEVAVITARQKVDVAEQAKLEEEQKKLASYETKKQQIALGQGEAERKRLVMNSGQATLDAWVKVNGYYAQHFSKQKWVPEVQMGGSSSGAGGNSASAMIDLLTVQSAKALKLDMSNLGK